MKLNDWCKKKGISYGTGLRWFHAKKIPNSYQMDTLTIIVDEEEIKPKIINNFNIKEVVLYARVSNRDRKEQLEYQVERLNNFAITNGFVIANSYKEIASGMNDERKILWKMINSNPSIIIVENKDRLTRFGFKYLENLLLKLGTKIIVVNTTDNDKQDLINDFVSIITSFCCRLYGLRCGKNKSKKIIDEIG
jgi:predicted site-specific integrase-resolvase